MGTLLSFGRHHGARFSRCVSVGNQADLALEDFLGFLVDDPATRAIGLYIEGLKDPRRFRALLQAARAAGKPVFVVKAGRSEAGAQARAYLVERDYAAAESWARRGVENDPMHARAHWALAATLGHLGRTAEARAALEAGHRLDREFSNHWMEYRSEADNAHIAEGLRKAGLRAKV